MAVSLRTHSTQRQARELLTTVAEETVMDIAGIQAGIRAVVETEVLQCTK